MVLPGRTTCRSAKKYFERAQALNPDDWNYHRQDWSFTPGEAGAKWMEKFQKLEEPYYPKLDLEDRETERLTSPTPATAFPAPVLTTTAPPVFTFQQIVRVFEFMIFIFVPS